MTFPVDLVLVKHEDVLGARIHTKAATLADVLIECHFCPLSSLSILKRPFL